jgi:general secretion pathway protein G
VAGSTGARSSNRVVRPYRQGFWRDETAFSLVETLVVCALISTLASMGTGIYLSALEKARVTRAIGDIHALDVEIGSFAVTKNRNPATLVELGRPIPIDPWGRAYVYTDLSQRGSRGRARKDGRLNPINSDFDLYSMGKDGRTTTPLSAPMSKDDVIRARDGAFLGLASEF